MELAEYTFCLIYGCFEIPAKVGDENALKATLKKKTKGLLSKEITGVTWEGGQLASTLNLERF